MKTKTCEKLGQWTAGDPSLGERSQASTGPLTLIYDARKSLALNGLMDRQPLKKAIAIHPKAAYPARIGWP